MIRRLLAFAIVGFLVAASLISAPPFEAHRSALQADRPIGAAVTRAP